MGEINDFFFSPHASAQERRLRAALQDGVAHGSRIEPYDPVPGEPVKLLFTTNASKPIERVAVYYSTDGTEPAGEYGKAANGIVVMAEMGEEVDDEEMGMRLRNWHAVLPGQADGVLVRYRADAWNVRQPEMHWYADNADPVTLSPKHGRVFAYAVDRWHTPQWFYDAVIYHIFVDRFSTASDEPPLRELSNITGFFGGTLRGVREKLDYISALGVNCLWLSPVFESPTHHGYNPSDFYTVASRYGTNETLRQLIAEAHGRGIRVLLDFVANHTSDEHPFFVDARSNPQSAKAEWYAFGDWPPHGYRTYALVRTMPELSTDHPEVQHYLIDAALHCLDYLGADGLRLDYVPGPSHAFWAMFQREIKQHFPEALTLAEITSPLPQVANYAGRMDACMDFSLAKMLRRVFALRKASLAELLAFLDERMPLLPPGMARATLLDNHDMHRFLWLAGGNKEQLKLAVVCHMTLEGTPIIYYGSEVGLSQYRDAHKENAYARAAMIWDERQDTGLLQHYRHLVGLRHRYPALRYGERVNMGVQWVEPLDQEGLDEAEVGAYLRVYESQFLLVVLNNGRHTARMRIRLVDELVRRGIETGRLERLRDVLTPVQGKEYVLEEGELEIELPALRAAILEPMDVAGRS